MGFLAGTAGKIVDPGGFLVEKTQDALGLQQYDIFSGVHGTAAAMKAMNAPIQNPAQTMPITSPFVTSQTNQNQQGGVFALGKTSLY
jgi:hypothetical protein